MLLPLPVAVHPLPLDQPELAISELAEIIADIRDLPPGAAADVEPLATEVIESAADALLLAVVAPPDAAPALLTGVALDTPAFRAPTRAATYAIQDALEDLGGPDVRETIEVPTVLGPAVLVQRVPGQEQARAGRPLSLQLQAFVPDPETGRTLLLTLACSSAHGWGEHQLLFREMISWITLTEPDLTAEEPETDSFEADTFQL